MMDINKPEFEYIRVCESAAKYEYDIIAQEESFEGCPEEIIADKQDYAIASFCGLIAAAIDVFWVGDFSIVNAQNWGRDQAIDFVIRVAKKLGCKKNDIESSIIFLEKEYKIPSDSLTPEFGGGYNHHLRDFAHHPTIVGLIVSIMTQFTGKGYGTDKDGRFVIYDISSEKYIGSSFKEKIYNGIVVWILHLISDMAGSSNNPGKGTGIPGPILGLLKEISALPIFHDDAITSEGGSIDFYVFISKLFNSTQIKEIRFDLRTEVGITHEVSKQALPVIINDCLVKAFYFVKRLFAEIKRQDIKSFSMINSLDKKRFLPNKNRAVIRMITVSSVTFNATEKSVAFLKAAVSNGGIKDDFAKDFLLSINIIGIGHLIVAIKNEIGVAATDSTSIIETKASIIEKQRPETVVDIGAFVENDNLYSYTFDQLLEMIEASRDALSKNHRDLDSQFNYICKIGGEEFEIYSSIVQTNQSRFIKAHEELFRRMFKQNGIYHELVYLTDPILVKMGRETQRRYSPFVLVTTRNGKKIAYRLSETIPNLNDNVLKDIKNYEVDIIKYLVFYDPKDIAKEVFCDSCKRIEEEYEQKVYIQTIHEFMNEYFGPDEYEKYLQYVDDFKENARIKIGFDTILMSSDEMISKFKRNKCELLSTFDFTSMLPNDVYDGQKKILYRHFFEEGRYKSLVSNRDFAESFISSEWHYDICSITNSLDKTAVVTGYLKSIEQLLYRVICLYKNTGKTIKAKGSTGFVDFKDGNENLFDTTLGALIGFAKHYSDIFCVNGFVKHHITETLDYWRDKYRNDHLHKDNIYSKDEVIEIRIAAIYLYFLILGGMNIPSDKLDEFGVYDQEKAAELDTKNNELTYERLCAWLDPVLAYGLPDEDVAVSFNIYDDLEQSNEWSLQLTTTTEYSKEDSKWTWKEGYSSGRNLLSWNGNSNAEAYADVVVQLKKYLKVGKYKDELLKYDVVAVSFFCRYKDFFGDHIEEIYEK